MAFMKVKESSVFVPGDERSRTNPGHGYPEHTEHSWRLEVFADEEAWKAEIVKLAGRPFGKTFKAIRAIPAKITTQIRVTVNEDDSDIKPRY